MRKIFKISFFLVFAVSVLFSQTVSEKKAASFPQLYYVDAYAFRFDGNSGTYFYSSYDTTTQKYGLYSNKGNSKQYSSISDYTGIIDKEGNYYVTASNNVDTVYTYYMLKNGEEIASFEYIDANWAEKNGSIYFSSKENGKYRFVEYNISTGAFQKSSPYDEIYLVFFPINYYDSEPVGTIGFTPDNKPYYLAMLNNEKFLVIGGAEQKHYSDIDMYNFAADKNNVLTYFAKDNGIFYVEKGNSFVVQGDKEYKKFDYLYGPILFDNSNTPVYISGDSAGGYIYPQRVVTGNSEGKTYTSGISEIRIMPSGRLAYVASNTVNADAGEYESFLVIDGKEGKHYRYINSLNFLPDGTPVYFGNKNDKGFIVKGNEEIPTAYPDVYDLKTLNDGGLAYVEVKYGNYEKQQKDKYLVTIGDEKMGPYEGIVNMYWNNGAYILVDDKGNYAFIAMKLIDFKSYIYEYIIYSNNCEEQKSEYFDNVYLYKGKPMYTTSKLVDKKNYVYEYKLYYGDKKIGSYYHSIADFKFNDKTGVATFRASRNKDIYSVEVKF